MAGWFPDELKDVDMELGFSKVFIASRIAWLHSLVCRIRYL
jgi:hypothetical protein